MKSFALIIPVTVTAPELGDYLGLTEHVVCDLARKGTAVRAERGRYRLKELVRAYCESMRRNVTGRGEHGEPARLAFGGRWRLNPV